MVGGYCATGKSTFARRLSERLGVPCFCKDTVKEAMADGFGEGDEAVFKHGSAATFRVMLHVAESVLQVGGACILEANFRLSEGEDLKRLVEKYDARCLTYVFTGDLSALHDRYVSRQDAGARHWIHLDMGVKDDFVGGHVYHKTGEISVGKTIRIDATDFEKINYEELFAAAEEFLKR